MMTLGLTRPLKEAEPYEKSLYKARPLAISGLCDKVRE
jgi:hypothetical protein